MRNAVHEVGLPAIQINLADRYDEIHDNAHKNRDEKDRARRLLLTAGPWLPALVADLALPLTVERQVMFWFPPAQAPERFAPDRMPIYNWEFEPGRSFYGMPELGSGCKIARHHEGESTRPDRVRRTVTPAEVADLRDLVRRYLPGLDGPPRRTAVCLYTNTPDYHFLLDFHPRHRQVLLASPCSGHGFKYASVLGAVLAGLTLHERSEFDLTPFSLARLTAPADSPDA